MKQKRKQNSILSYSVARYCTNYLFLSVFNALYRLLPQFLYNHLYLTVDKNFKMQPFR